MHDVDATNPLRGFQVARSDIEFIGQNLQRPECILADRDGCLWSADARGGVMKISADGSQSFIGPSGSSSFSDQTDDEVRFTSGTLPNGLALAADGSFVIANFGTDRLESMDRNGTVRCLADAIDGQPIGKVNFVLRDSHGRYWLTVSTQMTNWMEALRPGVSDGYIAVYDPAAASLRIVAEGFRFTNEIRFDAREEWLYVVETCGPCITRLRFDGSLSLMNREIFGPDDHGALIDGIAFDVMGNLWGTYIMADGIFALTPEGERLMLLDDAPRGTSRRLMDAFYRSSLTPELMLRCHGSIAPWMASVTFGGADLKTVYIGSLMGTTIPYFRSPVAGLPLAHWHDRIANP